MIHTPPTQYSLTLTVVKNLHVIVGRAVDLLARGGLVVLPADGHVHSEWSCDAPDGSMERTCARALDLGLRAVAFTEHADYTPWTVLPGELDGYEHLIAFVTPEGSLAPPAMDLDGYLECVQRCRDQFPGASDHQRRRAR